MKKILVVLLALCATSLYAHVPYHESHDTGIAKPFKIKTVLEKSIAIYSHFDESGDVDVATFVLDEGDFDPSLTLYGQYGEPAEGQEGLENEDHPLLVTDENGITGRRLHLGSLVPGCASYGDALPVVAVVGPRQEYLRPHDGSIGLPFTLQDDQGVYLLNNPVQGELWLEKFTFKSYFDQAKANITLTQPGKYWIYVWDPSGSEADYVLEIGDIEVFGAPEIIQALWYEWWLVNDGEIRCAECREELVVVDGPNPTPLEVIEKLMFLVR